MASTPEMVDSVKALILADRRVIIENISEPLGISMATVHKIVHDDLALSKVCCHWVPKMLMPEHKQESPVVRASLVENSYHILLTVQIVPSDFYLLGPLKEFQHGAKFSSNDEMKIAVTKHLIT